MTMKYSRFGFTLIEVLVTLIISSMILLIGAVSMKFMVSSLSRNITTLPTQALAYIQLRRVVAATYPYVIYTKKTFSPTELDYHFFYNGNQNSVRFITKNPLHGDAISVVEFSLENNQLLYKETPLYSNNSDYLLPALGENPYSILLMDNISDAKFSYDSNTTSVSVISGELPKCLKLVFTRNGEKTSYIFEIQTDFNTNIDFIRRRVEII